MQTKATKSQETIRTAGWILGAGAACLVAAAAFLGFFSAWWYVRIYGRIGFDSVIFTLSNSLSGVDSGLIMNYITGAVLPTLGCTAVIGFFLFFHWKPRFLNRAVRVCITLVLSAGLLIQGAFNVELVDYVLASSQQSELYEAYYVDPSQADIRFPEEKRNLVYIVLESMEISYLSQEQGGGLEYNLIPELYNLAQNNINFSHNQGVGGFREVPGASWTIGSLVAHTSGVPLKTPEGTADWQNGYGGDGVFLPGLYTIFNVLKEQNYYQSLMVGSAASFGGREAYYTSHGVDKIYDLSTARQDGIVPWNYWNDFWGMEDLYLFEYAKQELTEISQKDQPFAFTLLTVDTHHIGGYTCALCGSNYEESYENAIACSSRQVADFVQWLTQQDFYDNTTVVITGDHCSMDAGYFNRNVDGSYRRHIYNCFINSATQPVQTENRQFSALDMFPTTLAAMGCTIEGDRLGLGTNLFSRQPTMIERMGYTAFCTELAKRSEFYSDFYGPRE